MCYDVSNLNKRDIKMIQIISTKCEINGWIIEEYRTLYRFSIKITAPNGKF